MAIKGLDLSGAADRRVFGLLAGRAGIGKTTQATTFPKEQTLYVSAERGELSIQGSGLKAVSIENYNDAIEVLGMARTSGIKYMVIDSLSEIYDLLNREARGKYTAKQNFAKHEDLKDQFFHLIRSAKNFYEIDIFFICHTKNEKNGPVMEQELAFDGKMPEDIKKQFDVIIHMDTRTDSEGKEQRVFITSPEVSKVAKARVSPFMNIELEPIEEPNLYNLVRRLKGEK